MIRKKNKMILIFLFVLFISFAVGYAVLNTTLIINGTTNIKETTWNLYIDNIFIKDGSVEAIVEPEIDYTTSLYFEISLDKPGDFYEFTFDLVNDGTIDAMIYEVNMDYNFGEEIAKYLDISLTYDNDLEIKPNQSLKANKFVRYKVHVSYKNDIEVDDLPDTDTSLYIDVNFIYSQAGNFVVNVPDDGAKKAKLNIISGDLSTPGSEFCLGEECFYVLAVEDNYINTLTKYNLYVGNEVIGFDEETDEPIMTAIQNPTGIQNSKAKGLDIDYEKQEIYYPFIGCYPFSKDDGTNYYNSDIYNVVENYGKYITRLGYPTNWQGLIRKFHLDFAGCDLENDTCENTEYAALFNTSFWLDFDDDYFIYGAMPGGKLFKTNPSTEFLFGIRPMITFEKEVLMGN